MGRQVKVNWSQKTKQNKASAAGSIGNLKEKKKGPIWIRVVSIAAVMFS